MSTVLAGKICIVFLASPLHDKTLLASVRKAFLNIAHNHNLVDKGIVFSEFQAGSLNTTDCDAIIAVVATGGTETLQLRFMETHGLRPIVFVAHDKANSLPALLEAAPILKRRGASTYYVQLREGVFEKSLNKIIMAMKGVTRLRGSRLGLVGGVSSWLVYSTVDPLLVEERRKVKIVDIPTSMLIELLKASETEHQLESKVVEKATRTLVPETEVAKALRMYVALRKLLDAYKLDALSVKCFDILRETGVTACLAVSLLNDEGVPAGCEGDIPATLTMMLGMWCTGEKAFMANPSLIDGDRVLLSHCTAPLSMCGSTGYELNTHYETNRSVGVSVAFREGETVTIARLSPELDRIRLLRGVAEKGSPKLEHHCRSQMLVRIAGGNPEMLLDESIGNHHVVLYGDHIKELKLAAEMLGVKAETPR